MTLKLELKNLDTTLQQGNLDNLIDSMLDHIGSVDPELRDTLIYNSFGKLIQEDCLTKDQLTYIFEVCLQMLFTGIGQKEDDSVFTRTFSALVLALLLQKDRETRFLSQNQLTQGFDGSINYLKQEVDIRGHVDGKGWAHSIAHGADLLTAAISHTDFDLTLSTECLHTIKLCLFKESTRDIPYVDEEEERLIFAVEALQEKGVTDQEIEPWLLTISDQLNELLEKEDYSLNFFWKKSNVINFLRAYYFRLFFKKEGVKLRDTIAMILEQWHKRMYG